jgi:hypothetical protein
MRQAGEHCPAMLRRLILCGGFSALGTGNSTWQCSMSGVASEGSLFPPPQSGFLNFLNRFV